MIKRNQEYLNRINAILDFLLVFFSYIFSAWFRLVVLHGWHENQGLSQPMIIASIFYSAGLLVMLSVLGFYNSTRVRKLSWKLSTLFAATTLSIFAVTTVIFAFKIQDISRGIIAIFYILTLALLGGKQILTRLILNQLRSTGYNIKHEILVGTGRLSQQYMEDLANEPELGIKIDENVGADADLESLLSNANIDEVVLALEPEDYANITKLISVCEKNGVKYFIIPFYNDMIPAHPVFENIGRTRMVNMRANRLEQIGWAALKRAFDFVMSALGIIVLSPLLLFLAIGVKLSSPGPILFRQERVGLNRQTFQMLKFRSMVVNDQSDTAWSKKNDDRRTKFGAFMRKTSLDELPQLFNVLKGEMSLVGPRPELPYFVEKFKEEIPLYMVKHQVKPGITGWAQVNGYRGDSSIKKRIELDLWYIDNWNPLLDLRILFMTVPWAMINDERMEHCHNMLERGMGLGMESTDLWFDPLFLVVKGMQDKQMDVLNAIKMFADEGLKSTGGLSNNSNGAPKEVRPIMDSTLVAMCMMQGLTSAIINPNDRRTMETIRTCDIFKNYELYSDSYLDF